MELLQELIPKATMSLARRLKKSYHYEAVLEQPQTPADLLGMHLIVLGATTAPIFETVFAEFLNR